MNLITIIIRVVAILSALLLPLTACLHIHPDNATDLLLPSYDYIIVGGGVAGLVVANRLSEDSDVTILVLEAGELDTSENTVTVPAEIGHGWNPQYDWNVTTTRQSHLDNQSRPYALGHVVGGSSILNGLVMARGSRADYDAWRDLGNEGWGWSDMLPYFIKSKNFSVDIPPSEMTEYHINPDMSVHGTSGPLQVTYPKYLYNQSSNFLQGLSELGIPLLADPNAGTTTAGGMIIPASMTVANQSRADARTAYLDPVLDDARPNLHLASEQTVTRVLLLGADARAHNIPTPPFPGGLRRAYGVEFASTANNTTRRQNVTCTREVILAAGAVLSPVLLQVSGVGPARVLQGLNVTVEVDLPGVGQNLQDHAMVPAYYNYSEPGLFSTRNLTAAAEEYFANHTGPWTAPLISTVAFPSLGILTAGGPPLLLDSIAASDPLGLGLPRDTDPTVLKGYARQREVLLKLLRRTDVGALEVMADSVGTLTVAIHHPFSRGTVRALSGDLLLLGGQSGEGEGSMAENVALDPRYCAQPEDCDLLVAGLRFNGKIAGTCAMQRLLPRPGGVTTGFHPVGTTSMMPLELGGVVDTHLLVYGTQNLRVVDAGIIPLIPEAHLQAVVYAVAEKAADIIKMDDKTRTEGGNGKGVVRPPYDKN
ncbi:alcohol oxidase [Diplogelasinospora grovesii]|uniref:Alcohol oxidase n=1 Tax=Diplogelasinospora grovesii TaxID=303347 RepID=A0AAN6S3M1_9PEZI|nr:alcohol oxidase [Diplogelasinospora grovesii]